MTDLSRRRSLMANQSSAPAGVVFYDRLVGDGKAYIDTGFNPDKTHSYVVDYFRRTRQHTAFGATVGWDSNFLITLYNSDNKLQFRVFHNGAGQYVTSNKLTTIEIRITFNLSPTRQTYYVNGVQKQTFGAYSTAKNISKAIHLFGCNSNGTHSGNALMDFYQFSIKDSEDTLLLDLVPCTYNGEAGMWDMVSNTFFGNAATSGSFTVEND